MTGMQASLRSGLGVVAFGVFVGLMGACAKGDALDGLDGDGEGGSGGSGRTNGSGPTTKATTGGLSGPSSSQSTSGPSSNTTGSSVTNGSSTTGPTTTSNNVASSSSGGPVDCDPQNPGPGCGAAQHCVPQTSGDPLCEVAGAGTDYQLCPNGRSECAPIYECVFDGLDACCMRWCQVAANDCGGAETCTGFNTPAYINGVEYGVCWDGYPCVI
jgi:hypothetical protein